ncbi:hypothetical protein M406DRAFT_327741 [Cryphonectria parasitica EP155]|uniref:Uncharacterized protein n=1 Tax=Cryphonectria parasitica (strain ATCC 38755 / EP155) TaxID=660469 RepID=A0A9P4YB23_CRYP1|nr:uncharacterized protein M406DRAFT_327741 [Cryphonectria parasitica EP155]KAF3769365.1 hypothetical protein M406DRAFT_327741 [Cryphonectria parasitica EP155]
MCAVMLDPKYLAFVRMSDPAAPRLLLELEAYMPDHGAELCLTMPYRIQFTVTRSADDGDSRPLLCSWSPWGSCLALGCLVLLHENAAGDLERVEAGVLEGLMDSFYNEESRRERRPCGAPPIMIADCGFYRFWTDVNVRVGDDDEVEPSDHFKFTHTGAVVGWWDWGSKENHVDTVVKLPSEIAGPVKELSDNGRRPTLVVPGCDTAEFV